MEGDDVLYGYSIVVFRAGWLTKQSEEEEIK